MKTRHILPVLAAVICAVLTGGCCHKEISDGWQEGYAVRILYDWHNDPEASPSGMTVWVYPRMGRSRQIELDGREGGVVTIPKGVHDIISCNSDARTARFVNTDAFSSHFVHTMETDLFESVNGRVGGSYAPRGRGAEGERVISPPDPVWGTRVAGVTVTAGDTTRIVMEPTPLTCHYSVEIRNVSNLMDAEAMCACVTGLAAGVRLGDGELSDEPVTLPFAMTADRERGVITGEFLTFGHHPSNKASHRLILYVWMSDGRRLCYGTEGDRFDVTRQVDEAPDPRRVSIVVDGLDLPAGFTPGVFQPGASDWVEIRTDIPI